MEARKYKPNSSIKFSSLLDTNYNPFKHYQYNIFVQKNLNRHMVHARFDFRCARRNWIQTSAGPTVNSDTRVVTKIKPFLVLDLSQFHTRQHLLEATFCMSEPRLQNGNITLTWPKSDAQKAVRDVTGIRPELLNPADNNVVCSFFRDPNSDILATFLWSLWVVIK